MKWIGLVAIVLALLGAGFTSRRGLHGQQNPSLPEAITARIAVAQIVSSAERPEATITITPVSHSGPLLTITPLRRAGSTWIDRPIQARMAGDVRVACANSQRGAYAGARRCRPRLSPLGKPYL